MKEHCGRHNSCDRIMRIRFNVDRNILIQYDYQLTHYDRRECLCAARNFFKPAGTLCPLPSKRLYNLVAEWQTPRLPRYLNPCSMIDNPPLLHRVSNWRDWID